LIQLKRFFRYVIAFRRFAMCYVLIDVLMLLLLVLQYLFVVYLNISVPCCWCIHQPVYI